NIQFNSIFLNTKEAHYIEGKVGRTEQEKEVGKRVRESKKERKKEGRGERKNSKRKYKERDILRKDFRRPGEISREFMRVNS
ncbi:hypothetical protein J4Y38_23605, partial [Escherichia coli]